MAIVLNDFSWGLTPRADGKLYMSPEPVFPTDQELRDAGYSLAIDHGIVGDGVTDNTAAFNTWITDVLHWDRNPGYLHYSDQPYMISDTLRCTQWHSQNTTSAANARPVHIQGGAKDGDPTARPTIKLMDNSSNFQNPSVPWPMLRWTCYWPEVKGSPYDEPNDPYLAPSGWRIDLGNQYSSAFMHCNVDTGDNNPGAIGVSMAGAQRCYMDQIRVEATGSHAGFAALCCTDGANIDLEVIGGTYGVMDGPGRGSYGVTTTVASGLRTEGTKYPIYIEGGFKPCLFVGFEFVDIPDDGDAMYVAENDQTSSYGPFLLDGTIEFANPSSSRLVFDNRTQMQFYAKNVYISGTDNIVHTDSLRTASGTWKRIKEYIAADPRGWVSGGFTSTTYDIIDGVTAQNLEPVVDIESDVGTPPTDLRTRHIVTFPRLDDGQAYENAADYGAVASSDVDSRPAIQAAMDAAAAAAHNRTFIPKGTFYISEAPEGEYGIKVPVNGTLFGIQDCAVSFYGGGHLGTVLAPFSTWLPTTDRPVIVETTANPTGQCTLSGFGVFIPTTNLGTPIKDEPDPIASDTDRFSAVTVRQRCSWSRIWFYKAYRFPVNRACHASHLLSVEDYGGGQFYAVGINETSMAHPEFRMIRVLGPDTKPCHFYTPNQEINKGTGKIGSWGETEMGVELNNCSNVRFYGQKREGDSPALRSIDSTNWAFYGESAYGTWRYTHFWIEGTSDDFEIGFMLQRSAGTRPPGESVYHGVIENRTPYFESPTLPLNIITYRRGTLDDDAMWT